jgi:hypothetical protein
MNAAWRMLLLPAQERYDEGVASSGTRRSRQKPRRTWIQPVDHESHGRQPQPGWVLSLMETEKYEKENRSQGSRAPLEAKRQGDIQGRCQFPRAMKHYPVIHGRLLPFENGAVVRERTQKDILRVSPRSRRGKGSDLTGATSTTRRRRRQLEHQVDFCLSRDEKHVRSVPARWYELRRGPAPEKEIRRQVTGVRVGLTTDVANQPLEPGSGLLSVAGHLGRLEEELSGRGSSARWRRRRRKGVTLQGQGSYHGARSPPSLRLARPNA